MPEDRQDVLRRRKQVVGIPEPGTRPSEMLPTVRALKEAVEFLMGVRKGSRANSAVTWQDLVNLGLIEPEQIPRD